MQLYNNLKNCKNKAKDSPISKLLQRYYRPYSIWIKLTQCVLRGLKEISNRFRFFRQLLVKYFLPSTPIARIVDSRFGPLANTTRTIKIHDLHDSPGTVTSRYCQSQTSH